MTARLLKQYWGYDAFRPLQEDIINHILAGKDTLALLPTGGGKSVCYQLPALALEGFCLVISPLISLMEDQLRRLKAIGIDAACLHAGMSYRETEQTLKNMLFGPYKLLYISPERLQSARFRDYLPEMNISFTAIDEAHCVSQWGHDFRPDYMKIAGLREWTGERPFMALTASATAEVKQDILQQLQMPNAGVFSYSFRRDNIFYDIDYSENKNRDLLKKIPTGGSGIIYCRSRKQSEFLATYLKQEGIPAGAYHAGMEKKQRSIVQEQWMEGSLAMVAATTAFGMGIDKANVRAVLHYDLPEDIESYYQESGRAGRDGKNALAYCVYNNSDIERLKHSLALQFPPESYLRQVYQAVAEYLQVETGCEPDRYYDFDLNDFCKKFKLDMLPATYALKLLARQGLWTLTEAVVHPATLQFTCSRHDIDHLEERYPNLHYICTGILRMYGTVFHFPTTIRLGAIAKQLRLKIEDIQSALTYLTNMQLLQFTQAKEGPQLYFHHYRVDSRHLILDTASIAKLKQQKQKRIDALWQFVTEETACRERMILHYFGEESTTDCGHCDNCQKRLRPYVLDEDKIKAEIAQHLKNYPVGTIQDIVHLFEERHQTKVIYLIRELAEKEILAIDLNNQYQCKKT